MKLPLSALLEVYFNILIVQAKGTIPLIFYVKLHSLMWDFSLLDNKNL